MPRPENNRIRAGVWNGGDAGAARLPSGTPPGDPLGVQNTQHREGMLQRAPIQVCG